MDEEMVLLEDDLEKEKKKVQEALTKGV